MFDVPSVGEDFAVDGFQLVGTWTEYFRDDVRPFLGWGELVAVLITLHEAENKVPEVEGSVPHPSAVVPTQRLLVLGRTEEGDVASFIKLVHGVFVGCLGSLFVVCSDSWRSIVEVGWEDGLRTVDHEEGRVAGGSTRSCPEALEY